MKLDRSRPYGVINGHEWAVYEQSGVLFDAAGETPGHEDPVEVPDSGPAEQFLLTILNRKPLSKSVVFKTAEENNQDWKNVKAAAEILRVVKFKFGPTEFWKLPEEV